MCINGILETTMSRIAITCGDPGGIGPEIIYDWWHRHPVERKTVAIIGPKNWLNSFEEAESNQRIAVSNPFFELKPGSPSEEGARIALEALDIASRGCIEGRYRAVVTAPISKEWVNKVGFRHPGQTEFFAETWGGDPVMGFVGEKMIVTLATWHMALSEVPKKLTECGLSRAIRETDKLLQLLGKKDRRIGVCGLNPHAGEGGLMGTEERGWINPLLSLLRESYPGLSGTLSADTAFYRHVQGEFDAIIALYHDQGLGPLKTIEFDTAVNVTLGLPYIRTSPDHGTAFGIAGKGIASSKSLDNAIALAQKLSKGLI